ncbi:MAG: hypothetical protein ABJ327_00325, partial [Litoreibacter sp.]
MQQPRQMRSEASPEYEDAGLFKGKLVQISVELFPQLRRNSRHDLVVQGIIKDDQEIAVVFAGRRVKAAAPLEAHLKAMRDKAQNVAIAHRKPATDLSTIRCKVQIEGAWRLRFERDQSGW